MRWTTLDTCLVALLVMLGTALCHQVALGQPQPACSNRCFERTCFNTGIACQQFLYEDCLYCKTGKCIDIIGPTMPYCVETIRVQRMKMPQMCPVVCVQGFNTVEADCTGGDNFGNFGKVWVCSMEPPQ